MLERIPTPTRPRLVIHLGLGLFAGALYAFVDLVFDERLGAGPLHGLLASVHTFIDHVLPVITGLLFGAVTYALAQRGLLAAAAAHRAAMLGARLGRVERDQAVWVLAASVLHEVRNPLHSLGLLVDDLVLQVGTDNALVSDLADRARQQMDRIDKELLILRSLHEGGRPEPQSLDLRELVDSIGEELRGLVLAEQIALQVSGERPVPVMADPTYVRLIVENLIANSIQALRHLPRPAHINLEVEHTEAASYVLVRDTGPGPGEVDAARLFEPLRSTKAGGLGLGLPISRALARALEGDVTYDGSSAGETTFRLTLPAVPR